MSIPEEQPKSISFVYRASNEFDLYLPPNPISSCLPLIVFFHGGGLVTGSPKAGMRLPWWLLKDAHSRGFAFASAGYSFLPKYTAFDVCEDAMTLMKTLVSSEVQEKLPAGISINAKRICLVGSSAGGYVAKQAALLGEPKPAALGLLWGMGGSMLTEDWLRPHLPAFFEGYERPPGSSGPDYLVEWFQDGSYLDHFTGREIAEELRRTPEEQRADVLAPELRMLFPEFRTVDLPPTFLIHGREDSVVLLKESERTHEELKAAGIPTVLKVVEGEHSLRVLEKTTEYQQSPHWPALQKEMCDWLADRIA